MADKITPEIKKKLFNGAMKGKWDEVKKIYEENSSVHMEKITKSGQTALHLAVSDGQGEMVAELVDIIYDAITKTDSQAASTSKGTVNALEIKDDRGNIPLHIAAALGNVGMCQCMAEKDKSLALMGTRNCDGETPLFVAALHGHKDAFLCLHYFMVKYMPPSEKENKQYSTYYRRNDGDNILHCAISGDYFDLAFQIIHLYKKLDKKMIDGRNEDGVSPLHLLATKLTAFRSGSHLRRLNKFIYHCIFVEKLSKDHMETWASSKSRSKPDHQKSYCPKNYDTCYSFMLLLKKVVATATATNTKATTTNTKATTRDDEENPGGSQRGDANNSDGSKGQQLFPPNYATCFEIVKLAYKSLLIILGLGSTHIRKIREKKQKHTWSVQVLDQLLDNASEYEYENDGTKPVLGTSEKEGTKPFEDGESGIVPILPGQDSITSPVTVTSKRELTPILIAAKNGITEIVERILDKFPVAIHDMDADKKNIVLLAVENRQPHVYQLLLKIPSMRESVFRKVDNKGNSALHLAATLGDHKPWLIPGAALQMQWELKWYEFVKDSMPFHFFVRYNKENKTPKEIFSKTHSELVKAGGEWLTSTSESCSVVAALIATVAFATSTAVPGGVNEESGTPTLENQPAFNVFAIASLVALCFSVTAVVMFLSILTSRYQENDFGTDLPRKLLVGLTSLFVSIASMLISFCAGHFFVLKDKLKYAAFPVYAVTCLPVSLFAIAQFPLYFDLAWATFIKVPQRSYKSIPY